VQLLFDPSIRLLPIPHSTTLPMPASSLPATIAASLATTATDNQDYDTITERNVSNGISPTTYRTDYDAAESAGAARADGARAASCFLRRPGGQPATHRDDLVCERQRRQ